MIRSVLLMVFAGSAIATAAIPPLKVNPLGTVDAPVGGILNRNLAGEPETFSPINAQDGYSSVVREYVMEGLLYLNPDTYEFEPGLAESYEVSKDFLLYTFHLNKNAKWFDGQPVTSEDVKFTFDLVKDPAFKAAFRIPYYEDVDSVEASDPLTVKVKMKKKYFKNLEVLSTIGFSPIVPKHIYGDPKKKFEGAPLFGSGAYKVEAYNRGKNITIVRNPDWWAKDLPNMKSIAKFERINFRFIKEENLQLEMVKKGQLDYVWPIRVETYEQKAVGEPFGTTIRKVQAENKKPKLWGFVAWNFKNPIFKDKNVRIALSHLLNRKLLIEKFQFGKAVEGVGPFYYKSQFASPSVKPIEFSPTKAAALLKKAGWTDKEKKGVLQKEIDGKTTEFRFTLLLPNRDVEKYFTLYKEDLKKAGIDLEIKLVEWSTFTKLLEEQKFDAVTLAWGNESPENDLKQVWHSESARLGGSNFISYSNKEVDKLIDQARGEMDTKKRVGIWQKAGKLISEDAPYTFLFNLKYDLYLVNKRVGFDKTTYTYDLSHHYWYMSKDI